MGSLGDCWSATALALKDACNLTGSCCPFVEELKNWFKGLVRPLQPQSGCVQNYTDTCNRGVSSSTSEATGNSSEYLTPPEEVLVSASNSCLQKQVETKSPMTICGLENSLRSSGIIGCSSSSNNNNNNKKKTNNNKKTNNSVTSIDNVNKVDSSNKSTAKSCLKKEEASRTAESGPAKEEEASRAPDEGTPASYEQSVDSIMPVGVSSDAARRAVGVMEEFFLELAQWRIRAQLNITFMKPEMGTQAKTKDVDGPWHGVTLRPVAIAH